MGRLPNREKSVTFSERLREERKRLKLNQSNFGEIGGVTKKSQIAYEGGSLPPYVDYLERISAAGVDIQYLFLGIRSGVALAPEEKYLLALYRDAPQTLRKAAIAALASGSLPGGVRQMVTIGGDNTGIIAGGDLSIHDGRKPTRGK